MPESSEIARRFAEGPVWTAVSLDQSPVGTVSARLKPDGQYVRSMAVLPAARGQNVGRLLMESLEAFAREQRCRRLYLYTTPFLGPAIRLYERSGFTTTGPGPEFFGTPLIEMERTI